MVFKLYRESGLPIVLEESEMHEIKTLELQGHWVELDVILDELKNSDDLKEILFEADSLVELKIFLTTIDDTHNYLINFENKTIAIQDGGRTN